MKMQIVRRGILKMAFLIVTMPFLPLTICKETEIPLRTKSNRNENKYFEKLNQQKEKLRRRSLTIHNALPREPDSEDFDNKEAERILQRKRARRKRKKPQRKRKKQPPKKSKGTKGTINNKNMEETLSTLIETLNDMIEEEENDKEPEATDKEAGKTSIPGLILGGESVITNLGSEGDVSMGGSEGEIDNKGIEAGLTSESTAELPATPGVTNTEPGERVSETPKRVVHDCVSPATDDSLPCPDLSLAATCDKYNIATKPDGSRVANFRDCYQLCKPSFCCIHDSRSQVYSPTCRDEPNCPLYFPCYIIWWKLHDTIGPANFLRVGQREPFYDTVDFNYILTDLNTDPEFFRQLFGHHFDTEFDGPDDTPSDADFQNSTLW